MGTRLQYDLCSHVYSHYPSTAKGSLLPPLWLKYHCRSPEKTIANAEAVHLLLSLWLRTDHSCINKEHIHIGENLRFTHVYYIYILYIYIFKYMFIMYIYIYYVYILFIILYIFIIYIYIDYILIIYIYIYNIYILLIYIYLLYIYTFIICIYLLYIKYIIYLL